MIFRTEIWYLELAGGTYHDHNLVNRCVMFSILQLSDFNLCEDNN